MTVRPIAPRLDRAAELDAADPLAAFQGAFLADPEVRAYFDGNSLGRPLHATRERLAGLVDTWSSRLIRGWDEGWMTLPEAVGDRIRALTLGAGAGQVVVADSTTVVLYKLVRAGLAARRGRDEILIDDDSFPTDRFVVERVAAEFGLAVRWLRVDRHAGVEADQVAAAVGERTALVVLSHVAYRSSHLADAAAITALAHDAGALVLWDLCHSVGSVPIELDSNSPSRAGWGRRRRSTWARPVPAQHLLRRGRRRPLCAAGLHPGVTPARPDDAVRVGLPTPRRRSSRA
jgi:kynureninase